MMGGKGPCSSTVAAEELVRVADRGHFILCRSGWGLGGSRTVFDQVPVDRRETAGPWCLCAAVPSRPWPPRLRCGSPAPASLSSCYLRLVSRCTHGLRSPAQLSSRPRHQLFSSFPAGPCELHLQLFLKPPFISRQGLAESPRRGRSWGPQLIAPDWHSSSHLDRFAPPAFPATW